MFYMAYNETPTTERGPKMNIDINDIDAVRDALSDPDFIWEL